MEKILENYETYKSSSAENWENRLTWMGLSGREPKYTTSIHKFNKETNAFANMKVVDTASNFFNEVSKLADVYVEWVKSKNKGYTKKEYEDMRDFFVGAVGEIFFYRLFTDVKCIMAPDATGTYMRYDFNFVSPTLKTDKDAGVDFTAAVNDTASVIQTKFWNPFARKSMELDIIQKAYAEGVSKQLIDKDEKKNVFICWLGSEESVYRKTKEYKQYRENVVAIGYGALDVSINNRNKIFWSNLYDFLKNIS